MPIGIKKGTSRYGVNKGEAARGRSAYDEGSAGKAFADEFGKRKIKPSAKRKQGPTTENYESKPKGGRQWGQP